MSAHTQEAETMYHEYAVRERRTVYEILFDFDSFEHSKITLEWLLEALPVLKPREYSISTAPTRSAPGRVGITVGVVQYRTPLKRQILGLCSDFLRSAALGEKVQGWEYIF